MAMTRVVGIAIVLMCVFAISADAVQYNRLRRTAPAPPSPPTQTQTKPVTGRATVKPNPSKNPAQSKPAPKLPAGWNARRALTGGVSASLQRLASIRSDVVKAARQLARTSGVPITDDARDATLDATKPALIETETELLAAPPASFDFFAANPKCLLPARFQGMCGSCVTYAVTNSFAHRLCKAGKLSSHLSVPYMLGCGAGAKTVGYLPAAMCALPTDPFDLTPVLQSGAYDESCLKDRESTFQCGLFEALAPMINTFPKAFVALADNLPCVSEWRKDMSKSPVSPGPLTEASACPNTCTGAKHSLSNIYGLTAPPATPAENAAAVLTIQREILAYGPVPAIITETPEQLYGYTGGVFSYVKPEAPKPTGKPAEGEKKEVDLSALFLTTAHAVSIVGWGTENGVPYWTIENSWSKGWGNKGFFKLKRGANMLGIEGMTFALRTTGSGPRKFLAETKVAKIMAPLLGQIQLTLSKKRTFSPKWKEAVMLLHRLRTAIKSSADDSTIVSAMKALVTFVSPILGMPFEGDQKVGFAFQMLMYADSDVEDIALLDGAGMAPHAATLKALAGVADGSNLGDAQMAAIKAFIADHRAAIFLFSGEDPRVPYANTKDAFKRLLMISRANSEASADELKAFVAKHWSFLQNLLRYKLKKAGKL